MIIRTKGTLEDSGEPVDINDRVSFAAGEGDVVQGDDDLMLLIILRLLNSLGPGG